MHKKDLVTDDIHSSRLHTAHYKAFLNDTKCTYITCYTKAITQQNTLLTNTYLQEYGNSVQYR